MRDNAIGEVPASFQHRQTGFRGWPVRHDIGGVNQPPDGVRDPLGGELVTAR